MTADDDGKVLLLPSVAILNFKRFCGSGSGRRPRQVVLLPFFLSFRSCAANFRYVASGGGKKLPEDASPFATSRGLTPAKRGEFERANHARRCGRVFARLATSKRGACGPDLAVLGQSWSSMASDLETRKRPKRRPGVARVSGIGRVRRRRHQKTTTRINFRRLRVRWMRTWGLVVRRRVGVKGLCRSNRAPLFRRQLPANRTPRKGIFSNPTCI